MASSSRGRAMRVRGRIGGLRWSTPTFGACACFVRKRPSMTSLEYFNTPESVLPTELAFGELVVRDSPSSFHQAAVGSFFVALREHVRAHRAWGRVGRTARRRAGRGEGAHRPAGSVLCVAGSSSYREKENSRCARPGRGSSLAPTESRRLRVDGSSGSRPMASKNAGPITSRNNGWKSSRSLTLESIGG